ncbi:MAG: hypothetical protein A3J07_01565 [Candidatus Doudnabacteria bacterium RIFCSPLOWO2_02_FULL_49_13]|uniref:PDZ domain-containing protein n=1 Tax=Candidatus Doudnabacteria bacterium RIFCSPHIGHO2_12_FULL_48_16 TaxID=1817838 RepID=A0A1F5PL45_9BACT|nr:MAG: hypothetical protein A3B77_01150 [Candidatus Doudnabacteria bacterium RIFCSPHIGHO2_02_FULL_49_24]OGE88849.1 MAG: hypothetical protein A2760_01505 [Candidatus Doudnabacteria bacterium RIFCSPHIGHO2_01_FULL_50_67]OGE90631.1 MAG: hypothetical protein A3E29_00660 [Candidatus Doudnabacteria bacterium RIFCSPHIGHO2_12_FULL_48_16]OGE96962.1 MAG: hypothetical protein A2990_02690 [Candidatus Doudnabacteria bacterium RIFCSPLOWO2_01_FULL_49_40]OGF02496.1 MAG: hypothetical protein A3J07_01565 [Candid
MNRKQLIIITVIAFFVGAAGSIILGRLILPSLATVRGMSWVNRLVSNAPIVVNRREEVQFTEGVDLSDLVKRASNITVNIYAKGEANFLGNGIVVTSDGLIFTATEVIGSRSEVRVGLNDGSLHDALVHATDPKSNLAILTIEANNLSTTQFDNAANLPPGQRVVVLGQGNAEFVRSFNTGFVTSSVSNSSSLTQVYSSETFTQTIGINVPTGREFVGGPVLALNGRVIGMVTADRILIAENLQTALNSYLKSGKISRPYFGISYLNLSASLAEVKGLAKPGALVVAVNRGSPAEKAGLRPNDLIVEIDGQGLDRMSLERVLNQRGLGAMKLKVIRADQQLDLTAILTEK